MSHKDTGLCHTRTVDCVTGDSLTQMTNQVQTEVHVFCALLVCEFVLQATLVHRH